MADNNLKSITHEPIFSYGRLRSEYTHAPAFQTNGFLEVPLFIRPEALITTQEALQKNRLIFQENPNTALQVHLSNISRKFLWELHSGIMIRTLENITNLQNMLPDTHCHYSNFVTTDARTYNKHTTDGITIENICLYLFINIKNGSAILQSKKYTRAHSTYQSDTIKMCYWENKAASPNQ